jgi:CheY-like chemotaxis protein
MKNRKPTILVVEDNPDDQFMLKRGFKKIGVTTPVHFANDGLEAIAYMMGEGRFANRSEFAYPTFVMTDLKMPGADGFEVLGFLKKNR